MPLTLLTPAEVRVLGTLMEKEATTPEYYPLTLNALLNGCNQKSNRDPVLSCDAETIEAALESLRANRLVVFVTGSGRVSKYAQRISETLNLGRRESALLCILLLRGPQTLGELKDRSERMFAFGDLTETESVLDRLSGWEGQPLVVKLARQPGQKEARYAHLLSGQPVIDASPEILPSAPLSRLDKLELDLQSLRSEFDELRKNFEALASQLQ